MNSFRIRNESILVAKLREEIIQTFGKTKRLLH